MKPYLIGGAVVAAIIGAFFLGRHLVIEEEQGPAERWGKALDDAARELQKAAEDAK